jgi:hypothetical protein
MEFTYDHLNSITLNSLLLTELGKNTPVSFLCQTGYLTIDQITNVNNNEFFSLKIPNLEVEQPFYYALSKGLVDDLIKDKTLEHTGLIADIISGDGLKLAKRLRAFYSSLPSTHHTSTESFYHALLYAYCYTLMSNSRAEDPGAGGNLDLTFSLPNSDRVVIELKYQKDTGQKNIDIILDRLAKKALATTKVKRYGDRYRAENDKFIGIGLGVFGKVLVRQFL